MIDFSELANIVVSNATPVVIAAGIAIFAFIGWSRVPSPLAYILSFVLAFVYVAYQTRTGIAGPGNPLIYQTVAAIFYAIVLSVVYWVAKLKLVFRPKQPVKKKR